MRIDLPTTTLSLGTSRLGGTSLGKVPNVSFSGASPEGAGDSLVSRDFHPDLERALKPHEPILEMPVFDFANRLFGHALKKNGEFQRTVTEQALPVFVRDNNGLSEAFKALPETTVPFTLATFGDFSPRRPNPLEPFPTLPRPMEWRWKASRLRVPKTGDVVEPDPMRVTISQNVTGPNGSEKCAALFSIVRGLVQGRGEWRYRVNKPLLPVVRAVPRSSDPKLARPFSMAVHTGVSPDTSNYVLVKIGVPATAEYPGFQWSALQNGLRRENVRPTADRVRVTLFPSLARQLRLGEPSITPAKPKKVVVYDGPMFAPQKKS